MKYLKVWTSFRDVIKPLKDDEKGRLFDLMLAYAEDMQEPAEITGNERYTWPAAKVMLDAMFAENARLSRNGKKGGRRDSQQEPTETNANQHEPTETNTNQQEPTQSQKEKKRKEMKGNETKRNDLVLLEPHVRFIPPTADDVKAYCDERGVFLIDPERFVDYYQARNWELSKGRKMKDWKAAVRLWEKNERERQKDAYCDLPY